MLWAFFLLIAAVWAIFLIPPLWANRRVIMLQSRRRPAPALGSAWSSSDTFRSPVTVQNDPARGATRDRIIVRRKRVLVTLGAAAVASFVAMIAFGGAAFITVHVLVDVATIWYVSSLRRIVVRRRAVSLAQTNDEQADNAVHESRVRIVRAS